MTNIHSHLQVNILRTERDPFTIFLVDQAVSMHDLDTDTLKTSACNMTASVIELTNHRNLRGRPKVPMLLSSVKQRHISAAMLTYLHKGYKAVDNFMAVSMSHWVNNQ